MPDIRRLNLIIQALEMVTDEQVDMGKWIQETSCGTKACAAGWYVLKFPEEGLRFVSTDGGGMITTAAGFDPGSIERHYNSAFSLTMITLREHFALTGTEACEIFIECNESRPIVIENIKKFISKCHSTNQSS